ncbi:TetR/AcrR family transcriptional regulator [Streptomyces sp. NPDC059611]|uniref:TetR/AcrR family transcriptional regulator n=1 Tax=Streptomyces sp. NPDC059611 TaxID=3346884 RepID=UPI00368A63B3
MTGTNTGGNALCMGATPAPRKRGRPRTGQGLDDAHLLKGALDAFAEKGYDGMSLRELGRRLEVSHALLTARYGSKEGLWFAALEYALGHAAQGWRQTVEDPALDDLQALHLGIVHQIVFAASFPQVVRILNHEGGVDSDRIRFVVDRFVKPLRPLVEARLNRLQDTGRIRPLPYEVLHFMVVHGPGALFANTVESDLLGAHPPVGDHAVWRHAEAVADAIIFGLATPPAAGTTPK